MGCINPDFFGFKQQTNWSKKDLTVCCDWAVFVSCDWLLTVMGAQSVWRGSSSHSSGAREGPTKITWGSGRLERLANLPEGTQLVNGKGGICNYATCLPTHSVSTLICMNPKLTAHPSATSLQVLMSLTKMSLSLLHFGSKHTVVTFHEPGCVPNVVCIALFNSKCFFVFWRGVGG